MPREGLARLVEGAGLAVRGLTFALRNAEVRRAYLWLVLANVAATLVLQALGTWAVWHFTAAADGASGWVVAGLVALRVAGILVVLVAAPVVAVMLVNLALPVLAERLFLAGLRDLDAPRAGALRAAKGLPLRSEIGISLRRLAAFVALTLAVLPLSLVPFAGALLAPAAEALVLASFLAWELLDPWLAKEGLAFRAQRELLARHRALLLGFALPFVPLIAVPVVGPLFLGLAQPAAALLVTGPLRGEPTRTPEAGGASGSPRAASS